MEGYKEGNKSEKGKFLWGDWDKGGETGQLGDEYIFQTTIWSNKREGERRDIDREIEIDR